MGKVLEPLDQGLLIEPVWERQRSLSGRLEDDLWFHRFSVYWLPQGPGRSLTRAYNAYRDAETSYPPNSSGAPDSWNNARSRDLWDFRAEAFDAAQRVKRMTQENEARQRMLEKHVQIAMTMQQAGLIALDDLLKRLPAEAKDMTISELRLLLSDGIRLERQARGMPDWMLAAANITTEELQQRWSAALHAVLGDGNFDLVSGSPDPTTMLKLPERLALPEDTTDE